MLMTYKEKYGHRKMLQNFWGRLVQDYKKKKVVQIHISTPIKKEIFSYK